MKVLFLAFFAFSTSAFSQYLCTAHCGVITNKSERPSQGISVDLVMASSSVDGATAFKKLQTKCGASKLYIRLSAYASNLGTNSLGADGVFGYDPKPEATEENSCIKLGD